MRLTSRAARAAAGLVLLVLPSATRAADPPPRRWGRDRSVDIEHLSLDLLVDFDARGVRGHADLDVRGIRPDTRRVELDAEALDVSRVEVDGREARFVNDGARLAIELDEPLGRDERTSIRVAYAATPRNGLYFANLGERDRARWQAWSQGETTENRAWFPVHDDPSERLTSETRVTVERPHAVVANGPLLEVRENADGTRTFHHRMDFPHVPYLVSIAVGDWAVQRAEWEGVELTYHAPRELAADMERTFARTPEMLAFLSRETGVKYPYPVYRQTCVSDYIYGGMENIAATTLTDETLHDAVAHLDVRSESLVAHEAAHQWFGDYVTTRDWSDAWLNEGFATYYAALTVRELEGEEEWAHELDGMRSDAVDADAGDKRRPVVTNAYHDAGDLFDGHAYAKGAMVLHALRRELGDDGFRASVHAWLAEHAGESADTADLVRVVERVTGRDVSRFFAQWIYGSGQPDLKVSWSWREGDCAVTVEQSQAERDADAFDAPLDLELLWEDGRTERRAVRLSRRIETFHLAAEAAPRAIVADPDGWLLSTVDASRPSGESRWVLEHATSLLARMAAARSLKEDAGDPVTLAALERALAADVPWPVRREAAAALEDAAGAAAGAVLVRVLREDGVPRVRRAAASALAGHETPAAVGALREAIARDPSRAVRADAVRALGRMHAPGLDRAIESALAQPSHREVVRAAALEALVERRAPAARAQALAWSEPAKPLRARVAAARALGSLLARSEDPAERAALRRRLERLAEEPSYRVRWAALEALGEGGDADAAGTLRRIAASDPNGLTRMRARRAGEALARTSSDRSTLEELRRELDEEKRAREKLEQRLRELEARLPEESGP